MKGIKGSLKEKIAITRLKRGDTEAFGYLYDLYAEPVYRYIFFRISDEASAHDLMQDTFLQTWQYIVDKKPIGHIKSFIYKVAYNKVVDHYRSRKKQIPLIEDSAEARSAQHGHSDIDVEMHFLRGHLDSLSPEQQDVIALKYIEGFSIKEIAVITSKDATNVRVTLHRGMEALKNKYKEHEDDNET